MKKKSRGTQQWQYVRDARADLIKCDDHLALNGAWEALKDRYGLLTVGDRTYRLFERSEIESTSENPLSALMLHIGLGSYPPPELLLGLLSSWDEYLRGNGEKTLEEVFLGRPVRKGGNYARRDGETRKRMWFAQQIDKLVMEGMTQEQAAEVLTNRHALGVEAESVIRIARKARLFPAKRLRKSVPL